MATPKKNVALKSLFRTRGSVSFFGANPHKCGGFLGPARCTPGPRVQLPASTRAGPGARALRPKKKALADPGRSIRGCQLFGFVPLVSLHFFVFWRSCLAVGSSCCCFVVVSSCLVLTILSELQTTRLCVNSVGFPSIGETKMVASNNSQTKTKGWAKSVETTGPKRKTTRGIKRRIL